MKKTMLHGATRILLSGVALLFLGQGVAQAAAPQVVTVPWRGALDLPHETYNGKSIHLKGVAHNVAPGATASWDPGDGSGPQPVSVDSPDDWVIDIVHTYPNSSDGTPFTATLEVCNNGAGAGTECASDTYKVVVRDRSLDVEINIGIDEGLWYSHGQQDRSGAWTDGRWLYSTGYGNQNVAATAANVQAFEINNHLASGDPNQDPYVDTVARGLKYLFSRLNTQAIGVQPYGDPDTNGNGLGVTIPSSSRQIYELGPMMDAIVASKTPHAAVTHGPLAGLPSPSGAPAYTYFDAVQDMVDMYAWGQYDHATAGGGWRYSWNQWPDNSACQWAAIGILAARDLWGAKVPQFVYDRNKVWLEYSDRENAAGEAYGYGYTGSGEGWGTTPSGMVQLVMNGIQKTDLAQWVRAEERLAQRWNSWYRDNNNYYGAFAVAKAMRLARPTPIVQMAQGTPNQIAWFEADCANPDACNASTDRWGLARNILRHQVASTGAVNNSHGRMGHGWAVIILTGTLHLEPVAVATATPNPGAAGVPINFDGSGSFHTDPERSIVKYEWDWNNDGTFDETGMTASHAFACPVLPCTYPVTLQVTDDGSPTLVDTVTIDVKITNPPHPPTADADGPYLVCVNEQITLDGSNSFDVDEPLGDSITAWGWELDFVPPLDFDDASGETVTTSYTSEGTFDVGLRVTDDSKAVFGAPENLTDEDFTKVLVMNCEGPGVCDLSVRAKSGKAQLTWDAAAGAVSYDIYRSTTSANSGYTKIAADHVTSYPTYLDTGLTNGVTYWYRVVQKDAAGKELCGTEAASATPTERVRRR